MLYPLSYRRARVRTGAAPKAGAGSACAEILPYGRARSTAQSARPPHPHPQVRHAAGHSHASTGARAPATPPPHALTCTRRGPIIPCCARDLSPGATIYLGADGVRITQILKAPRRARRFTHIVRKGVSHGLGFLVRQLDITQVLPAWLRFRAKGGRVADVHEMPARLARVLEELGPTFVKFGQMLSSRADLLPPEYIEALQRICHRVAPFPGKVARSIVESELGKPAGELFEEFSPEPFASGSIAQVHLARLHGGREVVVKIRRPGIERIIDDDLAIMEYLAAQANRVEEFRALRLPMLVHEFGQGLRRELNLLSEAAYTHRFHEAFKGEEGVRAPKVYWDHTTGRVLTLERLRGVHLSEIDQRPDSRSLKAPIARLIMESFLQQCFTMGMFHADPHTGNVLVTDEGGICLVDFGLVGRISEQMRAQLSTFVIALSSRQMDFAAEVLAEIGSVPEGADAEEFSGEVAALMERNLSIPFERIELQHTFLEVMQIVRKYNVLMPRDFVLLGKALVTVGGMVMQLDPTLNAAEVAQPYARRLVRRRLSPVALARDLSTSAHHALMLLKSAPRDMRQILARFKSGTFNFSVNHHGLEKYLRELDRTGNRLALSIILAAIIMSSTTMMTQRIGPMVTILQVQASLLGVLGYLFGFVLGVFLVLGIFRSGRL